MVPSLSIYLFFFFFFFNDTATTEIYTLSLHDALPILLARSYFHRNPWWPYVTGKSKASRRGCAAWVRWGLGQDRKRGGDEPAATCCISGTVRSGRPRCCRSARPRFAPHREYRSADRGQPGTICDR